MRFTIKVDTAGMQAALRRTVLSQLPFAASQALNDAAFAAQKELQREIATGFDRPVPIVQKGVRVERANKRSLRAVVSFGGGSGIYGRIDDLIRHEFTGGRRRRKKIELLLDSLGLIGPGDFITPSYAAKLDSYGNVTRSQAQQIALQMRAAAGQLSLLRRSRKGGVKRLVQRTGEYFWSDGSEIAKGVWVRQGELARPVFIVIGAPVYQRRIDFKGVATRVVMATLKARLPVRLREALASRR